MAATGRGISAIRLGRGDAATSPRGRRYIARARQELGEYLSGRRTLFTVPVDLEGTSGFQAKVLEATRRIPFGEIRSYATLARRIGRPGAARAVGNALATNPVPIIVPCHRVVRGDGSWGRYGLGARWKTELLRLETRSRSIGAVSRVTGPASDSHRVASPRVLR